MRHGVGVIGAGPGVAALHLPTIARVGDRLEVVHISDDGSGRAAGLAARSGARASAGAAELLADPAVEVVAVCGPPHTHAEHVRASVAAGKRAVFCEKPLALDHAEAAEVIEACRAAGTALIVGTNHLFDEAWGRARHHIMAGGDDVRSIAITVALPPNGPLHELVTEFTSTSAPPARPAPDWSDAAVAAAVVRQLLLGLGIHDLPLVRDLAPAFERVVFARPVPPIGYAVGFVASGVTVTLSAVMLPDGPEALWRMQVGTSRDLVQLDFRPAFVHDGTARVRVRTPDGRVTEYSSEGEDGYVAEWRALVALLDGADAVEYDELLADAQFAIDLADAASALLAQGRS
ncbi:Gfo/Idh/MocA family protein [Microbacterium fluvii]|uniref:Gfo/Idh/MocA family protein n=1 Tax=Microbacterium fluvii TaxID=415215 RepID=A0ABW2HGA6_9MICO|nr:Gfo/Idh/MocA family oxidoreductase [Microbacterium fluvii]MCU4673248.1 Gfo/Idh/MocA family oxidoreductase [Microbacterium fluvii]